MTPISSPTSIPQEFAVKTQWSPLLLFLGLFLAGIVLWIVMLMRYGFFTKAKSCGRKGDAARNAPGKKREGFNPRI